ncbi:MAG: hypothetical protein HZB16_03780 [Armatimonadetes bacterium]|nr:hypothetical protein [Armatimonadota bacterium]
MSPALLRLLARSRSIDRRWIALATVLMLAAPLIWRIPLTMVPFPATVKLKTTIDAVPENKLIIVAVDWDSATKGECQPLTAAVIDYLLKNNKKFALFGFIPQGPELAQRLTEELARKYPGKTYGKDWVNWGYRPNVMNTLIAMMNDVPGTLKTDIRKNDLSKDPLTQMVPNLKEAGLLYHVSGTALFKSYLQFCAGVPLANAVTAVMGPEQYPYLQSGQTKGLLVGLGGAAQFEAVGDFKDETGAKGGEGYKGMGSQSLGHLLVMALIVLGNLGVWAQRRLDETTPPPDDEPSETPIDDQGEAA